MAGRGEKAFDNLAPTSTYEIGALVFKMMWHFSEFGRFILIRYKKFSSNNLQEFYRSCCKPIFPESCKGFHRILVEVFRPNLRKRFLHYPDRGLVSNPGRAFWRNQGIGFIQNLEVNSFRYLKWLSLKYCRSFLQNPGRNLFQNLGENSSASNIAEDSFKHYQWWFNMLTEYNPVFNTSKKSFYYQKQYTKLSIKLLA